MSEQKVMSRVSDAPTARQPEVGVNSNLSPKGVVGSSSFHSAAMSPLFEIVSSYLWTELMKRSPRSGGGDEGGGEGGSEVGVRWE